MDIKIRKSIDINNLSQDEAKWLKDVMQNKLHPNESPEDAMMRKKYFDILQVALED